MILPVYTWVFTIARNTLIDHFRKAKDEEIAEPEAVVDESDELQPGRLADQRLSGELLQKLLADLPPEEADVITLRAIDEMAYPTIATIIGKNEAATRKMYSRALSRLKAMTLELDQQFV